MFMRKFVIVIWKTLRSVCVFFEKTLRMLTNANNHKIHGLV